MDAPLHYNLLNKQHSTSILRQDKNKSFTWPKFKYILGANKLSVQPFDKVNSNQHNIIYSFCLKDQNCW